jgi:hypothetical protein
MFVSGSGYRTPDQGPGPIQLQALIDGTCIDAASVWTNETNSHKAVVPDLRFLIGVPAGQHTLDVKLLDGTFDGFDHYTVTIVELPH